MRSGLLFALVPLAGAGLFGSKELEAPDRAPTLFDEFPDIQLPTQRYVSMGGFRVRKVPWLQSCPTCRSERAAASRAALRCISISFHASSLSAAHTHATSALGM